MRKFTSWPESDTFSYDYTNDAAQPADDDVDPDTVVTYDYTNDNAQPADDQDNPE